MFKAVEMVAGKRRKDRCEMYAELYRQIDPITYVVMPSDYETRWTWCNVLQLLRDETYGDRIVDALDDIRSYLKNQLPKYASRRTQDLKTRDEIIKTIAGLNELIDIVQAIVTFTNTKLEDEPVLV